MGYKSDQTVDDMRRKDLDNFQYLKKKHMRQKAFRGKYATQQAMTFMAHCMINIQKKSGLVITPDMDSEAIDKAMEKAGIQIESREYDKKDENYISGVYIYKVGDDKFQDREIVGFVSKPLFKSSRIMTRDGSQGSLVVLTTWKG